MNKKEILDLEEKYNKLTEDINRKRYYYIEEIISEILGKEILTFDNPRVLIIVAILRRIALGLPLCIGNFYFGGSEWFRLMYINDKIDSSFYFRIFSNTFEREDRYNYFKIEIKNKDVLSKKYIVDISADYTDISINLSSFCMETIEFLISIIDSKNDFGIFEINNSKKAK